MFAFRFDLPLDDLHREIANEALRRSGGPFPVDGSFRDNVKRTWGFYKALVDTERPEGIRGITHRLDRMVYRRRFEEFIDDPNIADEKRLALVNDLDRFNRIIHSYDSFLKALETFITKLPGSGPVRILDIGSGHGAFPIRLAQQGELAGRQIDVTGSDINPAFVEKAQTTALKEKARVDFRVLDALQLDRMTERYDIITSSQTIHHFSPAFLAELMARVRKNALQGVLLLDDRRSAWTVMAAAVGTAIIGRNPYFTHDAVVSVRRMYSPAELELLGRCAEGGEVYKSQNMGLNYTVTEANVSAAESVAP